MELLVRSRNGRLISRSWPTKSAAPGMAVSSCTRTPSMSESQVRTGRKADVMGSSWHVGWMGGDEDRAPHLVSGLVIEHITGHVLGRVLGRVLGHVLGRVTGRGCRR